MIDSSCGVSSTGALTRGLAGAEEAEDAEDCDAGGRGLGLGALTGSL